MMKELNNKALPPIVSPEEWNLAKPSASCHSAQLLLLEPFLKLTHKCL